ncbi:MAG: Ig-like domain repeat protein [Candidatus Acidiferrales bacterium]
MIPINPMRQGRKISLVSILLFGSIFLSCGIATAQTVRTRSLITQPVDEAQRVILKGNTYPLARAEFDRGVAPLSLPMERMLLVLKRSPGQEAALSALLDQQQQKASPNFHNWLTPEQFGQQFGLSDQDIQTVTSWLQLHGFQVNKVTKGRTAIEFSGTAEKVQEAFHATIHKYSVDGADHWANSADPQIPTALAPVVAGIDTLHNFPRQPMHRVVGRFSKSRSTGVITPLQSLFTFGGTCSATGTTECFGLGPYDFAAIYDVLPLWNASPAAIDGSGQSIAIVAESDIDIQDIRGFRNLFGLPPNDPQIILDGPDPGIVDGDESESDLDVQWAGGVAKDATIKFVISATTDATLGVDLSAQYIVDNNIAPIMSVSYGICEPALGTSGNLFFNQLWQQAAAQGITVFVSTGDSGSAVCDRGGQPAQFGLQVSGFSSTPYNVGVGGTDFNDVNNQSNFWNLNNDTHLASAKGYIPELTWNDSCTNSLLTQFGFSPTAEINCNNPQLAFIAIPNGGSGGKSTCTVSNGQDITSCSGGYAKPPWQVGPGVPVDGKRDLPDVSLYAATGLFSASFYIVCEADQTGGTYCDQNPQALQFLGFGGTSASAPSFAGIMAMVDQKTQSRQGNANYVLYNLAAQPGGSCASSATPPAGCIFHDVTSGTIAQPCFKGSKDCTTTRAADAIGVLNGYPAGPGFDLATGLGSVDATNLVNAYNSAAGAFKGSTITLGLTPTPVSIVHGTPVNVSITVAAKPPATGTPTGLVSLVTGTGQGYADFTLANGSVATTTSLLPGGNQFMVTAHYPGDGTFGASDSAPVAVTVMPEASTTTVRAVTGNFFTLPVPFTSGPYGTPVFVAADVVGQSGNGIATGSVTFTDTLAGVPSGVPGNPFVLNGGGTTFTPNGIPPFSPGQHSITAAYSGDASFKPSNNNASPLSFTITKAATELPALTGPAVAGVGTQNPINVTFSSQSCGSFPTGTITLLVGVVAVANNLLTVNGILPPCQISGFTVFETAQLPQGVDSVTAIYNGDSNYAPSPVSPAITIDVVIPTTTSLSASPSTIQQGQPVTLTATVVSGMKGGPPVTGTVTFFVPGASLNPVPLSNGQAQVTTTTSVLGTQGINANYSGDPNYQVSTGSTVLTVTPGPDFSISANPQTVTVSSPGKSGSTVLTFTAMNGFNGNFNLSPSSCAGLPSESSCSFSPSSLSLNAATSTAMTTLTISTQAPSNLTPQTINWPHGLDPAMMLVGVMLGLLSFLSASKQRKELQTVVITFLAIAALLTFSACGGGGGGGPHNPGTPVGVDSHAVVSITAGGVTHSIQFAVNVQ